ncbi:Methionine aminopeptidase 2 [Microbotryomycetes sp. JL221]|nr:Methionine aminopeptidase 2 [Microbotryomycetes sp. JL221]
MASITDFDNGNASDLIADQERGSIACLAGGKLRYIQVKKAGTAPKCGDCHIALPGIPALRPRQYAQVSKRVKTVQRAYGGSRCANCVRDRIVRAFLVEEAKIVKRAPTMASADPDSVAIGVDAMQLNGTSASTSTAKDNNIKQTNGNHDVEQQDEEDQDDSADEQATPANGTEKKKPKKKKKTVVQTEPPTVPVSQFFKNGQYPVGECHDYLNDNSWRTSSEEMRDKERQFLQDNCEPAYNYNSARRAAEVHRQVRAYARKTIKPGMTMTEIANLIEDGTRALVEENGMESGIGFPTGLSLNHVAAHYTPNAGDNIGESKTVDPAGHAQTDPMPSSVLKAEDVLKVDIGVQVQGRIVDSAFTLNFEPTYDNLLAAVKDATETGVKTAGIDVRMGEIGTAIQEVMESYEVEVNGKTLPVKSIRNLTGHSIAPYQIHAGKSVPIVAQPEDREEYNTKMEEGEYFAIETFGSTGQGYVREETSKLEETDEHDQQKFWNSAVVPTLRDLVDKDLVTAYPPLADVAGSMTAQFEHTILLRPTCKEIISRGDDY